METPSTPLPTRNIPLILAGITGLLAVAIGAAGDHALAGRLDDHEMDLFETALRYHQLYSPALLALALVPVEKGLRIAFWVFMAGVVVFSGSLYAAALGAGFMTAATPAGGFTLMAGWAALIWRGIKGYSTAGQEA